MSFITKERFDSVDGLRGAAILMVVYQHGYAVSVIKALQSTGKYPYIVGNGWLGVTLFFILSGFVLSIPYFQGDRTMKTKPDLMHFYSHRANRLLPLFVFMCFVGYGFGMAAGPQSLTSLLLATTTLSMLTTSQFFPSVNPVFWSLCIEIWFCVMFPAIIWLMTRFGVLRVAAVIFAGAFLFRIPGAYFNFSDPHVNPLKDSIFGRLDDFAVGIVVAWLYTQDRIKIAKPFVLMVIGAIVLAVTCVLWDMRVQSRLPLLLVTILHNGAQIGFGLLLVSCLVVGLPRRLFSMWWLRILGAMCFSIYCWHVLFIRGYMWNDGFSAYHQIEYWVVMLVLSGFTYRYIEFRKSTDIRGIFRL